MKSLVSIDSYLHTRQCIIVLLPDILTTNRQDYLVKEVPHIEVRPLLLPCDRETYFWQPLLERVPHE
ncbi:hypothetical protein HY469_02520 [Candidatus Roizmanbacteria bacterium]|nr:hypothetical protein [Candidatus Roizmanbacteria bacterium]